MHYVSDLLESDPSLKGQVTFNATLMLFWSDTKRCSAPAGNQDDGDQWVTTAPPLRLEDVISPRLQYL